MLPTFIIKLFVKKMSPKMSYLIYDKYSDLNNSNTFNNPLTRHYTLDTIMTSYMEHFNGLEARELSKTIFDERNQLPLDLCEELYDVNIYKTYVNGSNIYFTIIGIDHNKLSKYAKTQKLNLQFLLSLHKYHTCYTNILSIVKHK